MGRYLNLLFDADNTLFDFYRAEKEALVLALSAIGVTADEEMISVYSRINDGMWKMLERGEITKSALRVRRFEDFCAYYGIKTDVSALSLAYTDRLGEQAFLMQDALAVCRELARHCSLYIITNGIYSVQTSRFARSELVPYFKELFISEEIGHEKPSKAFFDEVAHRIEGFDPRTALIIGDSLSSDIKGGIGAGIDTCWFSTDGAEPPADLDITYVVRRLEDVIPVALAD